MFLDCFGNNLLSIYDYCSPSDYSDDIFLFLSQCKLKYRYLDLDEVKEQHKNDPWHFQQVSVEYKPGIEIFDRNTYQHALDFIKDSFNINSSVDRYSNYNSLIELVNNKDNKYQLIAVDVDEFHLPYREKFYQKANNSHMILIKELALNGESFKVVDSNFSKDQTIQLSQLEKACKSENGVIIIIECGHYINRLNYQDLYLKMQEKSMSIEWLECLLDNLNQRFEYLVKDELFVSEGICFAIVYKILPMMKMRWYVLQKVNAKSELNNIVNKAEKLFHDWKGLSYTLLMRHKRGKISLKYLTDKLDQFIVKEKELLRNIASLVDPEKVI